MSDNVGNVMKNDHDDAIRTLVKVAGVLVYIAGILYAEIHGYNLMKVGVPADLLMWATIGIVALGISALFLPVGLHYSFHDSLQRYAAYGFYGVDLALLFFNAVMDYAGNTGSNAPAWLTLYKEFVMPATPIIAALGWSLLALLDPSQKERSTVEQLKASTRSVLRHKIAQKALSANVDKAVEAAAEQMAYDVIEDTLGKSIDRTRRTRSSSKKETIDLLLRDAETPAASKATGVNTAQPAKTEPEKIVYHSEVDAKESDGGNFPNQPRV